MNLIERLQRTGSRIVHAVESALADGIWGKQLRDEVGFPAISTQAEPPVRNRQAAE